MAVRATSGFTVLRYEPGNPAFPTLPDGVIVPHVLTFDRVAGLRARAPVTTRNVKANAPASDDQRFAGWQTLTTWANPYTIDFGVIPSPVRRTVSLYNARPYPITVTALDLPTGVNIITPSFPVTLGPYAGDTWTLEATTTGDNEFDDFFDFTTSEGTITIRMIGRRVFTLDNFPEAPMEETLVWKTDVLRSKDGTEKAYSLQKTPKSIVEYRVAFTNDIQRTRFQHDFIAGSSQLVVAGQKWYEKRRLYADAASTDTELLLDMYPTNAQFVIDDSISIVTLDGTQQIGAKVDGISVGPDPYIESVVVLAPFDGADGQTTGITNLVDGQEFSMLFDTQIDTAQSVFGGSSLLCTPLNPGFTAGGAHLDYGADNTIMDFTGTTEDFTIDFWFRPTATDISAGNTLCSRWYSLDPGARAWRLEITGSGAGLNFNTREGGTSRNYTFTASPIPILADTWHYARLSCSAGSLSCGIDGVEIGGPVSIVSAINGGDIRLIIGDYYDSGFTEDFKGHIDDFRLTIGAARDVTEAPPTRSHPQLSDTYTVLTLGAALGIDAPKDSFVMPVGLGYVNKFPTYDVYRDNLVTAKYEVTFNQERDVAELPTYFPTLSDGLSPETLIPILPDCNEIEGNAKKLQLKRDEFALDSGLSNRIAFNKFDYATEASQYKITLYSEDEVWRWRKFLHYIAGSFRVFYVPTFRDDIPGATTNTGNTFDVTDVDLSLLFGNPPDPRRNAIRLEYPDGSVYYRRITAVVDNGDTEELTVDSALIDGLPRISFMHEVRILGDTATFVHNYNDDVELTFRYRTILR